MVTPCCWESHPKFVNYRGEGEYTTVLEAGGTIRLEFKGVSHTAAVFLDAGRSQDIIMLIRGLTVLLKIWRQGSIL